jgi:hypothetical protein
MRAFSLANHLIPSSPSSLGNPDDFHYLNRGCTQYFGTKPRDFVAARMSAVCGRSGFLNDITLDDINDFKVGLPLKGSACFYESSGTFCVTLYGRRPATHRAFVTKKHQLRPAGSQTPGGSFEIGKVFEVPPLKTLPCEQLTLGWAVGRFGAGRR